MKKYSYLLIGGLTPFLCLAQEFTSEPVGREILTVESGFNYLGLRMHQKIVVTSSYASVTNGSTTIGVHGDVVDALTAGTAYLFEVESGTALGAVIPVTSFDAVNETLTLNDDVSGSFQNGDRFSIRPASTLASVFGVNNSAGLGSSSSFAGSDQVWLPDGAQPPFSPMYDAKPRFPRPFRQKQIPRSLSDCRMS